MVFFTSAAFIEQTQGHGNMNKDNDTAEELSRMKIPVDKMAEQAGKGNKSNGQNPHSAENSPVFVVKPVGYFSAAMLNATEHNSRRQV